MPRTLLLIRYDSAVKMRLLAREIGTKGNHLVVSRQSTAADDIMVPYHLKCVMLHKIMCDLSTYLCGTNLSTKSLFIHFSTTHRDLSFE